MKDAFADPTLRASEVRSLAGRPIPSEMFSDTRYSVERVIARGGFAFACLARRVWPGGDAPVVLKVIRPSLVEEMRVLAARAFKKESVALGRLNERVPPSPFVVRLLDVGNVDLDYEGRVVSVPWLALEYVHGGVEGETLDRRVRYAVDKTGYAFDPQRAATAVGHLAAGIAEIHAAGVIHRDLKPSNVLACGFGAAELFKISDFGIARPTGVASTFGDVTLGTAGYVAPEQLHLRDEIGAWTDVFSFACVIYHLLTGQKYFDVPSAVDGVMAATRTERRRLADGRWLCPELSERPDACRAIDAALARATLADPRLRTPSAELLAASVLPHLSEHPGSGRPSERWIASVTSSAPRTLVDPEQWRWLVLHESRPLVLRAVAFEGDGRFLASTTGGLLFFNGTSYLPVNARADHVTRLGPGRYALLDEQDGLSELSAGRVFSLLSRPPDLSRLVCFEGDPDDLGLAAGWDSEGRPAVCGCAGRRWLRACALEGVENIASLARVDDTRFLVVGRGAGGAYAALHEPLRWSTTPLSVPEGLALVTATGLLPRAEAAAAGPEGALLRVRHGSGEPISVEGRPHLSALALDAQGTLWAGGVGTLWHAAAGSRLSLAWQDPGGAAPFVSVFADVGLVVAVTAEGAVLEGRFRASEPFTRPEGKAE